MPESKIQFSFLFLCFTFNVLNLLGNSAPVLQIPSPLVIIYSIMYYIKLYIVRYKHPFAMPLRKALDNIAPGDCPCNTCIGSVAEMVLHLSLPLLQLPLMFCVGQF